MRAKRVRVERQVIHYGLYGFSDRFSECGLDALTMDSGLELRSIRKMEQVTCRRCLNSKIYRTGG
jgi:hypothetical protein